MVDTQGLLMQAIVHTADIQGRDGRVQLMDSQFGFYPFLLKLYADGGYQGAKFQAGLRTVCGQVNLEIVKRSDLHRFVVLPKRWIVERTIGAEPVPTLGQGLGVPEPKRARVPAPGLGASDAAKAVSEQQMIADGHYDKFLVSMADMADYDARRNQARIVEAVTALLATAQANGLLHPRLEGENILMACRMLVSHVRLNNHADFAKAFERRLELITQGLGAASDRPSVRHEPKGVA